MIRFFTFCLGALCLQSAVGADAGAAVKESSKAWRAAVIAQDKAALEKWLAEDLVYAHSNGKTESKAEYIASVVTGPSRYQAFTEENTIVRVYGDVAVLEGNVEVKPVGRDAYRVRTLEVYLQRAGRWRMTAHQSARLSK
jgi:ketosteroid isomerase-like protein